MKIIVVTSTEIQNNFEQTIQAQSPFYKCNVGMG